ncbi:hypothetical protein [Nesterenkonia pannonica]|uniref:hypothetical protein n=1 Tax=Nesterenkonia pannonica TaxID=1548602 RepID=UPI0021640FC1|nr:hypothetical protein [Nesterenkonia pannonica]
MGKVPAHEVQHTRLRDLSAAYWWLWFAELVIWIGRFVVPFMTLFLTRDVGLSASAAGLVVSGYGLGWWSLRWWAGFSPIGWAANAPCSAAWSSQRPP